MQTKYIMPTFLKRLVFISAAMIVLLSAGFCLWTYDRIGNMPFCDDQSPHIYSITARYSDFEPYELNRMEFSELSHLLRCIRVGLPVIRQKIFAYKGHPLFIISTDKGERTFQFYHSWHTDYSQDSSYLAYVIIDGVRYNCYDRILIEDLKDFEDKLIDAMEALKEDN